jgi:hypothetical protein
MDRQLLDRFLRRLLNLTFKSFFSGRFSLLAFGGTTSLAGLLRLFGLFLRRFLTSNNGRGIPADMPDQFRCGNDNRKLTTCDNRILTTPELCVWSWMIGGDHPHLPYWH